MASGVLYRPVGLTAGLLSEAAPSITFQQTWKFLRTADAGPTPLQDDYSWGEALLATATHEALLATAQAATQRGRAQGFQKIASARLGR